VDDRFARLIVLNRSPYAWAGGLGGEEYLCINAISRLLREALRRRSRAWCPFVSRAFRELILPSLACIEVGGGSFADHLSVDEPGFRAVEMAELRGEPAVLFRDAWSPKSGIYLHMGVT
jgi:hypothetical protein